MVHVHVAIEHISSHRIHRVCADFIHVRFGNRSVVHSRHRDGHHCGIRIAKLVGYDIAERIRFYLAARVHLNVDRFRRIVLQYSVNEGYRSTAGRDYIEARQRQHIRESLICVVGQQITDIHHQLRVFVALEERVVLSDVIVVSYRCRVCNKHIDVRNASRPVTIDHRHSGLVISVLWVSVLRGETVFDFARLVESNRCDLTLKSPKSRKPRATTHGCLNSTDPCWISTVPVS
ncbi:hypothetical protein Pla52n_68840 [Stieleria varia]|uniref:Uncharacterized protein n=1 Tax=Stieleria varia TaxID=2528005 RepID=A0A5C5ZPU1_9BACT|nr:hypothetical protein Pla52n_68840 [Stieleria varia]